MYGAKTKCRREDFQDGRKGRNPSNHPHPEIPQSLQAPYQKKMQGVVQFASSFYPPDCWNNTA